MSKVCIVFASMTGNTEMIKDIIEETLKETSLVDSYLMDMTDVQDIIDYDYILLGSYTYGDGDLPYEAEDFYDQLGEADLRGKKFACFGSGDSMYEYFCQAAVIFENKVKEQGGEVITPTLKIELSPDDDIGQKKCIDFAKKVASAL